MEKSNTDVETLSANNRRKGTICPECGGCGKANPDEITGGDPCEKCGGRGWVSIKKKKLF